MRALLLIGALVLLGCPEARPAKSTPPAGTPVAGTPAAGTPVEKAPGKTALEKKAPVETKTERLERQIEEALRAEQGLPPGGGRRR